MLNCRLCLSKQMVKHIKSKYTTHRHIKQLSRQSQMVVSEEKWTQTKTQYTRYVSSCQQTVKCNKQQSITTQTSSTSNQRRKQQFHRTYQNHHRQKQHIRKTLIDINNFYNGKKKKKINIIWKLLELIIVQLQFHIFKLLLYLLLEYISSLLFVSFLLISSICEGDGSGMIFYGLVCFDFFGFGLQYIVGFSSVMSQQPIPVKLVIVGDGSVGKTCILVSYTENKFPTGYEPTVFDNFSTTLKVDNKIVNLGLWDTAGQQQYNRLRPLAYPHCDVFIICFSVIDPPSFLNAKKKWYPQLEDCVPSAPKIFVGNKIDLREQYQKKCKDPKNAPIARETARKIIEQQMKCKYIECSALTQEGLRQLFNQAVRMVLKKKSSGGTANRKTTKPDEGSTCKCQIF